MKIGVKNERCLRIYDSFSVGYFRMRKEGISMRREICKFTH